MNAADAGIPAAACQWCNDTGTHALDSWYAGPCLVCTSSFTSDSTSNYDDDVAGRAGSLSRGPNGAAR